MIAFVASVGIFSACHTFPQQQDGAACTLALKELRLSIDSRELTVDRAAMEERQRAMIAAVQSQTTSSGIGCQVWMCHGFNQRSC